MLPYEQRRSISRRLRERTGVLADAITNEFLERHPDWIERYGDLARIRGNEDARFHIEHLASAILGDDAATFEDYARWTSRVLAARDINPAHLIENLQQVASHASRECDDAGRELVERTVAAGVDAVLGGLAEPESPAGGEPLETERRMYQRAILAGDRHTAITVAREAMRAGADVPSIYQHIVQPAQQELGRLWEANEISVAEEHEATAITQRVIAQLYEHVPLTASTRGKAVVTGVNGEEHQIGAGMIADVLEADGWQTRFLGTQLPHRDIVRSVEEHGPQLLGVSATVLSSLPAVADLLEMVRRRFDAEVRVIVGGRAFRANESAWRDMGADGFARDIAQLRAEVDRLFPRDAD